MPFLLFAFLFAFVGWTVGLVGLGAPLWWLLDRAGLRSWTVAVAFGTVAGFLVALVIWRIAYRRVEQHA